MSFKFLEPSDKLGSLQKGFISNPLVHPLISSVRRSGSKLAFLKPNLKYRSLSMKLGITLYRFGILGFLFAPGVLMEEPFKSALAQNHSILSLSPWLLLYCLPVLAGFGMLAMTEEGFRGPVPGLARLVNSLSALTIFWLVLWCFIWSGLDSKAGNQADPFVKYIFIVGLVGTAVGLGIYIWGWKGADIAKRTARFLMAIGWNVSFMSFLNLHLEPAMGHFKGPGVGGLLVIAGVYLIVREL